MFLTPRRRRLGLVLGSWLGMLLLGGAPWVHAEPPPLTFASGLELPAELEPDVRFWVDVFSHYGRRQVVIHDRDEPSRVLAVVSVEGVSGDEPARVRKQILSLLERARSSDAPQDLLAAELGRYVDSSWVGIDPDRIRAQRGQREIFAESLQRSREYLLDIRRSLRAAGLPIELGYLPHVESSFRTTAVSPAGAVGIWQLMPATARELSLRVDAEVDERQDPARATEAALAYLKNAYQRLESWPLAITSYNYGIGSTTRGVESLGTRDMAEFLARHSGATFGFASRNYYGQFLAAAHVAKYHRHYFASLKLPPLVEYVVQKGDTLKAIAQRHGVPVDVIREENRLGDEARLRRGQKLIIEG